MLNNTLDDEQGRYAIFDYVKGFAILLVIITHYRYTFFERCYFVFPYVVDMAVPLFIMVTGFLYSDSFIKKSLFSLKSLYDFKIILRRFLRLSVPFLCMFAVEYFFNIGNIRQKGEIFFNVISGQIGPGSYYFIIMLQIILVFPIIHFIAAKWRFKGFVFVFLAEFVYMACSVKYNMNTILFRDMVFRFLTLLYMGSLLSIHKPKIKDSYLVISLFIGIFAIFVNYYSTFKYFTYPYIPQYWGLASGFFIMLYIFPIFYETWNYFKDKTFDNIFEKTLSLIGKASWHIFLVQIIYFSSIDEKLYNLICPTIHVFLNISICTLLGILFYYAELKLKKVILKNNIY